MLERVAFRRVFKPQPSVDHASIMDSDELMDVDFPSAISKGKSKVVERDLPSDNDNLPWYVCSWHRCPLIHLNYCAKGLKNTDL